ncbi:MAG: altronate dehydratase family protein [Prevotellaceae bacterium]|jgi:altronate hydrolase|nr:altronate dehydratase family protein [Prevotellaceae bacterium]
MLNRNRFIKINQADNVVVAIEAMQSGETIMIENKEVILKTDIPAGHKIAVRDFAKGENIVKYGFPTGRASENILCGSLVNEKNVKTNLEGILDYEYTPEPVAPDAKPNASRQLTFRGYRRADGSVGIRNEIWIIPTVGCVNGIVNRLAADFSKEAAETDAVVAYPHNYGCSQLGDDHENTRKILRNMALHPNAGAALIVGLGCENNQPAAFREMLGKYDESRIKFLVAQEVEDEYVEGMKLLRELYSVASKDRRSDIPFSELKVGLKCGGSDGFSGITANPLLGVFSDFLAAQGGTAVLTEVPEMFGAETILMNRCITKEVFDKTVRLINDFKQYFASNNQPVYENPSPGNKAGGISTLEEKSLGCTQKSGTSTVNDVLEYGEILKTKGLNLMSAPGNDLVASTALAAAGCHIVLFTTGRGTPFGTFVPTMKISTNSLLFNRKPDWIDFNAGTLLEGEDMQTLAKRFTQYVIEVASGKKTNNEKKNYREIAIFKTGVTL